MSASNYAPPTTFTAVWAIAALTWRRAIRGRTPWVTALLAVLPVMYAALTYAYARGYQAMNPTGFARGVFGIVMLTLAISPAMNVASSLGEELEERTSAYLWSRPLARWTIAAGKLLALAPMVGFFAIVGLVAAHAASDGNLPGPLALAGVAAAAIGFCVVAAAIATIAPKNGMTLAICYALFIDLAMGALPISLRNISMSYHANSIAGLTHDSVTSGAIGLAVVAAIWMVIGLWRIRRME
jgi:ABC-type transport system involved in multi-copper enzyme maturation permease subunit